MLAFAAVLLAGVEVVMGVTARLLAPGDDVSTDAWTSLDGVGAALADYGTALVWVAGYAVLALFLAVLLRSVPLALGVGIAWAMPFEHITGGAWTTGQHVFPGTLLEALGQGGTPEVSAGQALISSLGFATLFLAVAATTFSRRAAAA